MVLISLLDLIVARDRYVSSDWAFCSCTFDNEIYQYVISFFSPYHVFLNGNPLCPFLVLGVTESGY